MPVAAACCDQQTGAHPVRETVRYDLVAQPDQKKCVGGVEAQRALVVRNQKQRAHTAFGTGSTKSVGGAAEGFEQEARGFVLVVEVKHEDAMIGFGARHVQPAGCV